MVCERLSAPEDMKHHSSPKSTVDTGAMGCEGCSFGEMAEDMGLTGCVDRVHALFVWHTKHRSTCTMTEDIGAMCCEC